MYQEERTPLSSPAQQPEHISIAMAFANEMLEKFPPKEQNEMLKLIRQRWSEHRMMKIEEREKEVAYIRDSLSEL